MKRERTRRVHAACLMAAVTLLGLLSAQTVTATMQQSITFDEDLHISTGYSVLHSGDLRLVEDHPPLIGLWMGWPLLLSPDVPDPEYVPDWTPGDRRLFVRNDIWWSLPIDSWVVPPRITVTWLALLLGAVLFRWAREWFGQHAAVFALALLVLDPNIVAHSSLATLDLGLTFLIFAAMYCLQWALREPAPARVALSGAVLGLALASKISSAILLPIACLIMGAYGLRHWRNRLPGRLAVYLGVAALTLWAAHLFQIGQPLGLGISLPAPTYWRSLLRVGRHVARGNRSFLMGETYEGGRWTYFPIAFALKTPLPALLLAVFALLAVRRTHKRVWAEMLLASLPVSYFIASIFNAINLGYRHLLPVLPFLYLFTARLLHRPSGQPSAANRWPRIAATIGILALVLWQAVGTVAVWPFHLTFFNELAGGPQNGYRFLADSNVDWGQGLKVLSDYLRKKAWDDTKLSSFTFFIKPEMYGIQATPLPPLADAPAVLPARFNPGQGHYVISASTLRGMQLSDSETYNWFWHREPDEIIGNSMLVYNVPPTRDHSWVAQCSVPVTPLRLDQIEEGFGIPDLRTLTFDCSQSWIYPGGGASAGWYVAHEQAVADLTQGEFPSEHIGLAHLTYRKQIPSNIPALSVYEWDAGTTTPPDFDGPVWAAPADQASTKAPSERARVASPVSMGGPLSFLGYGVDTGADELALSTYWLVSRVPGRAFSIMAHLFDEDGSSLAVGDALGIPWADLRPGDILVQKHGFPGSGEPDVSYYGFRTGGYWLDTLERWAVDGFPGADSLILPLN